MKIDTSIVCIRCHHAIPGEAEPFDSAHHVPSQLTPSRDNTVEYYDGPYGPLCGQCFLDDIYDGPGDGEAWSGGFAENH